MDILSSDNMNIQVPFLELQGKSTSTQLIPRSDFEDAYNAFRVLHIRGYEPTDTATDTGATQFQARDVQQLFESLNNQDRESWCIENKANNNQSQNNGKSVPVDEDTSASKFLDVSIKDQRGYCSFLVQHSETEMKTLLSNRLPMVHLPVANELQSTDNDNDKNNTPIKVQYGPCLWFFFGKNYNDTTNGNGSTSTATLQGRPEHTDSVTHDGTWHYQLSGTKIWRLRPTTELMQQIKKDKNNGTTETRKQSSISGNKRKAADADSSRGDTTTCNDDAEKIYIEVECKQGDILLLNTRLWWHSTLIPPQETPCISYARDVYFADSIMASSAKTDNSDNEYCQETKDNNDHQQQQSSMTNVDGTYAAEDVEAETVLFTEHTMPDCELHRSKTDANCQVVELEDDETGDTYMAVVSLRDIKAGEFFSILESDDDDDDDEGGDSDCEEEVEEWDDEDDS